MLQYKRVDCNQWLQDACLTEMISRPYHRFFGDLDLLFVKKHDTVSDWLIFLRSISLSVGKAMMQCFPEILERRATPRDNSSSAFCVLMATGPRSFRRR